MVRVVAGVSVASLLLGCAVDNAAFDPPREGDTEVLPNDGTSTGAVEPDSSSGMVQPSDETGGIDSLCNGKPSLEVSFEVKKDGMPLEQCGQTIAGRVCQLAYENSRWIAKGCCLEEGQDCDASYELVFGPTPPDTGAPARQAEISYAFRPAPPDGQPCKVEWVRILDRGDDVPGGVPEFLYVAGAGLAANPSLPVQAEPLDPLPDQICECRPSDADCCPEGLAHHGLRLAWDGHVNDLFPTDDNGAAFDNEMVSDSFVIELALVRAWQPPLCDAPSENQWFARRRWPL